VHGCAAGRSGKMGRVLAAAPPPPAHLELIAPAPREVSFGRIAGRLRRGRWAVVVRVGGRTLAVRSIVGGSFDFQVALPRRDVSVRVTAYAKHGRHASATVDHVFGLPRSASPRAVRGARDPALVGTVLGLARSFPGTSGVYVEDLVSGKGAAWNARARFPAASTLKAAIAVELLRTLAHKPAPGSYVDQLLRRMLIESDNDAANEAESQFGGGSSVDELLDGLGFHNTWMGGGYLRGTPALPPIPLRTERQPSFGCCKYTSALDLARLLSYVHLAAGGRGPLIARYGHEFTQSDARYLLYLLVHVRDRGKLGRFIAGGPYALAHKAGWISGARHDVGLVYWPGGVFVAAVMTWGSGVGVASDVLAGRVATTTLTRLRRES
jgi:Beta-lactamase enzyme family